MRRSETSKDQLQNLPNFADHRITAREKPRSHLDTTKGKGLKIISKQVHGCQVGNDVGYIESAEKASENQNSFGVTDDLRSFVGHQF